MIGVEVELDSDLVKRAFTAADCIEQGEEKCFGTECLAGSLNEFAFAGDVGYEVGEGGK